ncbi:hypothetical protein RRG08_014938 [Elysia crispata]|uniref:Uncharacterized protein n=1 Tax=Elysia crispata TaxID=231223 RepID=A0AAE1E8D3_9GAST|nr:hypothetical protein RRG08_014938 [Elysia crispata]
MFIDTGFPPMFFSLEEAALDLTCIQYASAASFNDFPFLRSSCLVFHELELKRSATEVKTYLLLIEDCLLLEICKASEDYGSNRVYFLHSESL